MLWAPKVSKNLNNSFVYNASKWNIIWHQMNAFRSIDNNKKDRHGVRVCVCMSKTLSYKAVYMTEFSLTFVFHKLDIWTVCACRLFVHRVCMLRIHYCCCCCCCCFAKKRQGCINFRVNAKSSSTQKLLCVCVSVCARVVLCCPDPYYENISNSVGRIV